ncbi:MAG TPA: glycogen/starch synthase [Spirochaetia bacterium]|nr:glycogen/starch synthase [Spirochaetia bacterium]
MKVLMVSSEAVPFAKSGGLADVVSALSISLAEKGVDVRILLPSYGSAAREEVRASSEITVPIGIASETMRVSETSLPRSSVPVYLLESRSLYGREGIYGDSSNVAFADNVRRFTALNRASFEVCRSLEWLPDIFHVHDWPTALLPQYLKTKEAAGAFHSSASVLTIHNIGYQGTFSKQDLYYTNLKWADLREEGESATTINFLRSGLRAADRLTTVSPTYATEIQSAGLGFHLEQQLQARSKDLLGILNGIDYVEWNPEADPLVPGHFSEVDLSGKKVNKRALQELCGFPADPSIPIIGIVSRLVDQKGFMELLSPGIGSLPQICRDMVVQVVVLGTGEPWCEQELTRLDKVLPNLRAFIGFDNKKAHLIEAGSDFFLMPSRYEPCGLNQMYSLRYATLPIVRRTGGLADTVEQYNQETGDGTGFLFDDLTPRSIYDVTGWAVWAWYNRKAHIEAMRRRAMQKRFSWDSSADQYLEVYDQAAASRRAHLP